MTRLTTITATFLAILGPAILAHAEETKADAPADTKQISYQRDIRPIFQANCQGCHQPAKALGDYVMTSPEWLKKPGETGDAPIVPGKPDESYLVKQITPVDGKAEMPKKGKPLADSEIAYIRRWIEQGAKDDSTSQGPQYDAEHPPVYTRQPVVTSIDYSPDGKQLAVAGFHEVLIHAADGSNKKPLARLVGMSERIESVSYSPDGKMIAVTGGQPGTMGEVQVWDAKKNKLINSVAVTFDTVYGASWSPDNKLLAFGCGDNTVRVIEARSGKQVLFQNSHSDWAIDTVFSHDGSHLATVGRDAAAKLIEVKTQRFVDNITSITPGALSGGINSVARHPMRDEVVFGGADGVPKIYAMHRTTKRRIGDDANQLWELPALKGRVFSVDYSQNGEVIAAGSSLDGEGEIGIFGIAAATKFSDEIKGILTKPTHERNGDQKNKLKKFFEDGIKTLAKLPIETSGVYAVSIRPDAKHVAAAGTDGKIRVIDVATGKIAHEFNAVNIDSANVAATGEKKKAWSDSQTKKTTTDAPNKETLPKNATVSSLRIEPAQIELASSTEYAQLVVLAETADGDTIDVTRIAKLSKEGDIDVSPFGFVRSNKNGTARVTAKLGDKVATTTIKTSGADTALAPDYVQDISPILARAGCNAGTCHGAKDGKNGFKLSLRGYDPIYDVRALTDDLESRRTNLASAENSLFLLKPTGQVPHEGGVALDKDGDYYRTLLAWVQQGTPLNLESKKVASIRVLPVNPVVQEVGSRVQMRVVATFADGRTRDVTREAFVESGNTEIAVPATDHAGLIEVIRRGEAPLLVRYEGAYAATTVTVIGNREGFVWKKPAANNKIDEFVAAKLERTKTATSGLCNDYSFVRRVYLDLTGLPPTPEQIKSFVDDAGSNKNDSQKKRSELIASLVGSTEYVEHWTNKWADLLQVNGKFLGREGATSFRGWIRDHVDKNTPYDQFAHAVITANGSNRENPAASYYKILRDPEATMENTTQLFLATRFNCNKCHDHPFERWTQDQYYELSAYFARVGLKKDPESGDKKIGGTAVEGAKPMYEIVYTKDDGEVKHLRTSEVMIPDFPFDCEHEEKPDVARREQLANWMTSKDNPYFAKSYANRIWAYLTGTGIIEPIDDIRAGNPPTNPELLDWLTNEFVESGFNTQRLVQLICESRTYQLALESNRFNEDDNVNYSHAKARRLPAEVLYDAIYRTTGAKSNFKDVPPNTRAASLPDVGIKLPDGFLSNLGRPARESACECERSSGLQMGPIMALINGATVGDAIGQAESAIATIVKDKPEDREMIEDLFLRILGRPAKDNEIEDTMKMVREVAVNDAATLTQLAAFQKELAPTIEKREKARTDALAAKKKELEDQVAKMKPERDRLAKEREDKIAKAKTDSDAIKKDLLAKMSAWESSPSQKTTWETLNPVTMASSYGEKFEILDDGSVFVSGKLGIGENVFTSNANLNGITGLRVEALTDERLPKNGPGRAKNDGNFVLSEIKLLGASPKPATIVKAWDFNADAEGLVGENDTTIKSTDDGKIVVGIDRETRSKQLAINIDAPAKPLALDIVARIESTAKLTLLWKGADEEFDGEKRAATVDVTRGTAKWRTYRVHFKPDAPVKHLQLKILGNGTSTEIDSMRLVETESPELVETKLKNAKADFSQKDYSVPDSIDGKPSGPNNGWAIAPQMGKRHVAYYETDGWKLSGDGTLTVKLIQNYQSKEHSLGRFRLSVTRSPAPIDPGPPAFVPKILAIKAEDRNDEQEKQLEEYYLGMSDELKKSTDAIAQAEKPIPKDESAEAMKMRIGELEKPLPKDAKLARLERAVELAKKQAENKRLTAAQDIAWALINSPEFLYNH